MTKVKASNSFKHGITFVIPAYNAAQWLEPTVEKILAATVRSGLSNVEIIIVDDGSSDRTLEEAKKIAKLSSLSIMALSQQNKGRFLTRKRGVEEAKYDTIFFVDTRVWIDEGSLAFILKQQKEHPERQIWNGHVNVAKKGNVIARFMDSITLIGWRRYFSNPKLVSYGLDDFDYYPKGTGMFLAPKAILLEAVTWFESVTQDLKNSSDDTLLIRHIAEKNRIWLSPEFSCTYFARTTLAAFVTHSHFRGRFFVDGFLRPGTRFYYPLIVFLVISLVLPILCIFEPQALVVLTATGLGLWIAELFAAMLIGLTIKDALSLFILSPVFAVAYGIGIWTAVLKRVIK